MIPFSVIMPVYNEIKNIHEVLQALYQQTLVPNEIIVVDGWSHDWTYEFLQKEEEQGKIRLLQNTIRHGNIARSRNLAIKNSTYDLILCTDAWCHVSDNRCESFVTYYQEHPESEIVGWASGFIIENAFQQKLTYRLTSKTPNFPSRNISFKKKVWEEVWWYPEFLTLWWEDTYFNYHIRWLWYHIQYCKEALVKRWLRKNYKEIFQMYRNYTQGDSEVFVVKGIKQSNSLIQALIFSGFFFLFLGSIPFIHFWSIPLIFIGFLIIWLYKRTKWGFRFDLHFSCAKILGIMLGFRKWLFSWWEIKRRIKNLNI